MARSTSWMDSSGTMLKHGRTIFLQVSTRYAPDLRNKPTFQLAGRGARSPSWKTKVCHCSLSGHSLGLPIMTSVWPFEHGIFSCPFPCLGVSSNRAWDFLQAFPNLLYCVDLWMIKPWPAVVSIRMSLRVQSTENSIPSGVQGFRVHCPTKAVAHVDALYGRCGRCCAVSRLSPSPSHPLRPLGSSERSGVHSLGQSIPRMYTRRPW